MPEVFMPRLSDTMEEGTLSQWVKHEGDQVRKGDVVAVIETDKAAMDLEAYDEGMLTRVLVDEGSSVPIGTPIAVIGDGAAPEGAAPEGAAPEGAPAAEPARGEPSAAPETAAPEAGGRETAAPEAGAVAGMPQPVAGPTPPAPPRPAAPPQPMTPAPREAAPEPARPGPSRPAQVRTSPLARALARRHGIDLGRVTGTGPGGRIVRADVEDAVRAATPSPEAGPAAAAPSPAPSPAAGPSAAAGPPAGQVPGGPAPVSEVTRLPFPPTADVEEVPLQRVRRITAERLTRSTQQAPHFYLTVVADAGRLLEFRREVNSRSAADARVSVTDLLVKACAVALASHAEVNSSWGETVLLRHRRIHVGVAVAIEDGLIVPVIRDADRKTLTEIAHEAHALTEKARTRRLSPDEISGSTFTISNLGMYGIDHFTAVINPPEAAILAVGRATRQPVVRDDQVTVGTTMALTLSIDHRVVDGATGAAFLADLVKLIEDPLSIVV